MPAAAACSRRRCRSTTGRASGHRTAATVQGPEIAPRHSSRTCACRCPRGPARPPRRPAIRHARPASSRPQITGGRPLQQPSLWVAGIVVAHRGRVDPVRSEGLELEEHVGFQRRDWLAQRIAWVLMVLFVGAAAVGLFGSGPLSRARADVPGLMTLEYDRFGRLETTEALKVRLEPAATRGGTVRL